MKSHYVKRKNITNKISHYLYLSSPPQITRGKMATPKILSERGEAACQNFLLHERMKTEGRKKTLGRFLPL